MFGHRTGGLVGSVFVGKVERRKLFLERFF